MQKLDLAEELLKLTELKQTEDFGDYRHILGIATTNPSS
jgi:hypothetical protein